MVHFKGGDGDVLILIDHAFSDLVGADCGAGSGMHLSEIPADVNVFL